MNKPLPLLPQVSIPGSQSGEQSALRALEEEGIYSRKLLPVFMKKQSTHHELKDRDEISMLLRECSTATNCL